VQYLNLDGHAFGPESPGCVRCWAAPSSEWLGSYARFNGLGDHNRAHLERIVRAIEYPCQYLLLLSGDAPVACGLSVRQADHVWLFDIAAEAAQRRKGHGLRLMNHVLHISADAGAREAYLQVTLDNLPAVALYGKLGFVEHHQYWYRTRIGR
jgi:ribosomal protein S18 acetylase RimI-like enzyme